MYYQQTKPEHPTIRLVLPRETRRCAFTRVAAGSVPDVSRVEGCTGIGGEEEGDSTMKPSLGDGVARDVGFAIPEGVGANRKGRG